MIENILITDVSDRGDGIGKTSNGVAAFISGAVPGDFIQAEITKVLKTRVLGHVIKIISPSEYRCDSECEYSNVCGGCLLRNISYEGQLKLKLKKVEDSFHRIGNFKDINVETVVRSFNVNRYRNKVQMPFSEVDKKIVCGFFKASSHDIIPLKSCLLQPKIFDNIIKDICSELNSLHLSVYNEKKNCGSLRHLFLRQGYHSNEIMCVIVSYDDISLKLSKLVKSITKKYSEIKSFYLNINPKKTNVILGKENILLWGNNTINDTMLGNNFELSPLSFYQINTPQAENLYSCAAKFADIKPTDILIDFYCGAGTISLYMARFCKMVYGVEIIEDAVKNAKFAAKANKISNSEFICADAGSAALKFMKSKVHPNLITLDPPRKGCDELVLKSVLSLSPQKIVYISCNPATCARDCKFLCNNGYKLVKIKPFDMFPHTFHVETVVLMSRVEGK